MTSSREIDVRPVEPKHRFETIMSAWSMLHTGDRLLLIVDHDPKCMYYTLVADHGEKAFSFDYLENGPTVWRVEVTKT